MDYKRILAITTITILILNLILLAINKIDTLIFWIIIIIGAFISYLIKKIR